MNDATITGYGIPKYAETNGNGSSSSKKKNSKKELQYLQKVLSRHATKAKTIKASEVETGKIPAGNVMITVNNGKRNLQYQQKTVQRLYGKEIVHLVNLLLQQKLRKVFP